ncbi:hypothetical protein PYW08_012069 [Mythimna loreyi]|uniref:Uncharacterized protein n=1 Tax=Mythimna loreyi TaxID=667449 RepID=A0ACC2Q470_9NEOP|nr:hypothetical protein PYW08_012069 [Mythimna loreyi]
MRVCASFLLLGICAYTRCSAASTPADIKRSVNLALETVLEFNDRDKAADIKFLDNVQNFITKVKTVINNNSNVKTDFRRDFKTSKVGSMTDFIQEVVKIFNTYDDTTFKDFFDILDEEIRKYHYRGCKFYELMENYEIRTMIAEKLDSVKRQPAAAIKANINTLSETLTNVNRNKNIREVVNYVDSLYRQDTREQQQKVLADLRAHNKDKSKTNLREVIKNAVRALVFDHYTNLNTNVRRDVKQKIDDFWKRFKPNDTSDNINNEVKTPKRDSRKHTANIDVEQSDYKEVAMKRDDKRLDKKPYQRARKDNIEPLKSLEKGRKIQSPKHTGPKVQKKPKTKHQEESSNSIEFYRQPKAYIQQKKAIHLKKIPQNTLLKSRKHSEKSEAADLTTRLPKDNTNSHIWIEESTGRLPKAVLDKLTKRPTGSQVRLTQIKHDTKHNNKYGKSKKSWHENRYERKHNATSRKVHNKKHQIEPIRKHWTKYESESTDDSSQTSSGHIRRKSYKNSNNKLHQYKKSKESFRVELNDADESSSAVSETHKFMDVPIPEKSSKTNKPSRGARTAPKKKLAAPSRAQRKRYDDARRTKSHQRKPSSKTSTTLERLKEKHEKTSDHQSQKIVNSLEKDLYVIKKIKNLEKELEEVKSKLKGSTKVKLRGPKKDQELHDVSESKLKQKQIETSKTVVNVVSKIESKHVQQTTPKYNVSKDNIEHGENNSNVKADENKKVTGLPQSSEPSKLEQKVPDILPLPTKKDVVDSKPKPSPTTETADNKIKIRNGNTDKLANDKSTTEGDVKVTKESINDNKKRDELLKKTADTNEILRKAIKDEGPKTLDKRKQSETVFRSNDNMNSNDFINTKGKNNLTMRTDNKTDVVLSTSKFNIEDVKNILKGVELTEKQKKQLQFYENRQKELLRTTTTTNAPSTTLSKTTNEKDIKSLDKDINSTTNITSNTNTTSNVLRSEAEKPNTKSQNNKKDDGQDNIKNNKNKIETRQLPPHPQEQKKEEDPKKGQDLSKSLARPRRPVINNFIVGSKPEQNLSGSKKSDSKTMESFQKEFIGKIASKYRKLMAEKAKKAKDIMNTGKGKNGDKGKLPHPKTVPKDPETKQMYDEFESLKNKLFNMAVMKPGEDKKTNKKPDLKTETEEDESGEDNELENMIGDTMLGGNFNRNDFTPVNRAILDASTTGTKGSDIKSTSVTTKTSGTTTKPTTTAVVTTPVTSKLTTSQAPKAKS